MKINSEIRKEARFALDGKWGGFAMMTLVLCVIELFAQLPSTLGDALQQANMAPLLGNSLSFLGTIILLLILPISWGYDVALLTNHRGKSTDISNLFDGFRQYGRVWITLFLQSIFTLLWTFLLVVPGIVKACSYAMTSYVLADNPDLSGNAAIERSMAMMEGHKMQYFMLSLSFIGWMILAICTLGIGLLWLIPYIKASYAAFYESVKTDYETAKAA